MDGELVDGAGGGEVVEGEGEVARKNEELDGRVGEKLDGIGAERLGLNIEVIGFQSDGESADALDFVGADVSREGGGVEFDEWMLDGMVIGPGVFFGDGAKDFVG